jgi:hypothetical protein
MHLEYTDEQIEILKQRLSFLHDIKTVCTAIFIICLLLFAAGPLLIYFNLPLIGVLVCIITLLPLIISIVFLFNAREFSNSLKNKAYKNFRITYKSYEKVEGTECWYKVVTSEGDYEVFYYKTDPKAAMPDEIDVMVCSCKNALMIAYDVI